MCVYMKERERVRRERVCVFERERGRKEVCMCVKIFSTCVYLS